VIDILQIQRTNDDEDDRRRVIAHMPRRTFLDFITGKVRVVNLPVDAKLTMAIFDPSMDGWMLQLQSVTFKPVPNGNLLDFFHLTCERIEPGEGAQ
jgi:hypothetical protein